MTPAQLLNKQELIKQLQDLAGNPALGPRAAELGALAHDVQHDKRLDRWSELDLVHAYVRPESVTARGGGRPSARRDGLLEAALGALVFVPLLVTWFGLREAVHAYGELSKVDRKEATRPFLQLWQSGFGGHLSPLGRFENVALMAVVLIALLVLLSVVHARVRARAEREEDAQEAERERLLADLAAVLTRLQMLLVPYRSASPKQFTSQLTQAAQEMRSLAAEADKNHKALVAATGSVTDATTSLQEAAGKLTAEVPKLGAAADRIETAVREGQQAAARTSSAGAAAARQLGDQVKTVGAHIETSLRSLVTAQQDLVTKTESVAQATEQACAALVTSTGRTNDAVDGMREATERWDAAAAHWQDAAARVDSGVRSFATAGASSRNGAEAHPRAAADAYRTVSTPYAATVPSPPPWAGANGSPASVPYAPAPPPAGGDPGPAAPPPGRAPDPAPYPTSEPDVQDDPALSGGAHRDPAGPAEDDVRSDRTTALRPPPRRPSARPGDET
ncbi:hypothetical protein [Streptomyces spectabilis]|uniref:Uncharacterized protein n=1 Tax=Streptomyces spectabilis TaxID=68270 RepID=A0A5P2XJP8_STRST|nr:hypothetical protein [Streptomyces spectabilis]MBB5105090.1 hypothetical protein [Streptomyces spectabilis]MCI3905819.1 hypothetical protein [Streptomyces spectabilis]QEV62746.1 hypothetical protein CP982_31905 [Streptomyces spectabilis]GGV06499.1 hypothetical protein GCM10010245_13220 [Streptomyces spectabilis]